MKNVLIVSPFFPYPLTSGGHQAIYNGMACLKGVANVFLVYTTTESRFKKGECMELEQKLPFVKCVPYFEPSSRHNISWAWRCLVNKLVRKNVATEPVPKPTSEIKEVANVLPNIDFDVLSEGFKQYVLSMIRKYAVDVVQMEMMETIGLVDVLPSNVRKVFVHHELRWVRNELLLRQIDANEEMRRKVAEVKAMELDFLNKCDIVVVLSETDKKKLHDEGVRANVLASFAVVEGEKHVPSSSEEEIKKLVYIGPSSHYPNYDGIMWFLCNCWEKLLSISEDYRLYIIGKWDEDRIAEIANSFQNVCFMGYVDDLFSVVKDAIEIVPLQIGSGIRMKILEAARLGVPVVSTTIGAEGLPLRNGEDIIIADTASEFVEGVCRLRDHRLREYLVNNMQQTVLPKFSLEALRDNRMRLYDF